MKKLILLSVVAMSFILFGCPGPENNSEPTFILTSPQDGSSFTNGDTVTLDILFIDEAVELDIVNLEIYDITNSKSLLTYTNSPNEMRVVDYKTDWIVNVDVAPANLRMTFDATNVKGQNRQGQISMGVIPE